MTLARPRCDSVSRALATTALILIVAAVRIVAAADSRAIVTVTLRPQVEVTGPLVRLADVAEIKAPSQSLVDQLNAVDVASIESPGDTELISARLIRIRLLLEGVKASNLTMDGARFAEVTRATRSKVTPANATSAIGPEDIRGRITTELAKRWLADPEDVEVQFYAAQAALGEGVAAGSSPEVELPDRVEPGRVSVRIRWTMDGHIQRIEQVPVDVRLRQTVVLAAASIPRGEAIDSGHLKEESRLLDSRVETVPIEQVHGLRARRSLAPGDIVTPRDVTSDQSTPVIKPRDLVKVIARKGKLQVVLQNAEALQTGRIGDVIYLRNTNSNQNVRARIVSPREAEVIVD